MGFNNYRWFIMFIFSHAVICTYGGIAGILVFKGIIEQQDLWNARFMNLKTNEPVKSTPYIVYRYLFDTETLFAFVTILCLAMSLMLGGFTMYHLWLAMTNVTTNERYKKAAFLNYYEEKLDFLKEWKTHFDDKTPQF